MSDRSPASWLFVPADRPERFEKAARADETILDLEDAVAPAAKPAARAHAVDWLSRRNLAWVRINGLGTQWHDGDIEALANCEGLRGLIVPKAEDAQVLERTAARLGGNALVERPIVALIETARGVRNLDEMCASPGVDRLALGSIDLALDIDAQESDEALLYARSAIVIASRAAALAPPIDGVTVEFRDSSIVAAAATRSRALGFGGKLCIHPAQVAPVNEAFAPNPSEIEWAHRVLAAARASDGGAYSLDGRMVDRPLLARARRLLSRAGDG